MTSKNDEFLQELRKSIAGEVRSDQLTCKIYSVDASIFEIEPLAVVLPKHREDIIQAVNVAKTYQIPLTARGAATGITGGCLGQGLIIDTSKYCNHILDIDLTNQTATVEPGVVLDTLNAALAKKGYCLGPETSSGNRATIGGMVANNAAGGRSLHYGEMVDHTEAVELVLASGQSLYLEAVDIEEKRLQNTFEGEIYRKIDQIRTQYAKEIQTGFPKVPRRVSGYNLDTLLLPGKLNLTQLIAGSEGTLGILTKATVKICPLPKVIGQCLIFWDDIIKALQAVPALLSHNPFSLEMVDEKIIAGGYASPMLRNKLDWLIREPKALFIAEFEATSSQEIASKLNALVTTLRQEGIGDAHLPLTDPETMQYVKLLRKQGLGLLLSKRSYSRALAFIEDLSIPAEQLAPFMQRFLEYLQQKNKSAGIYGHVGSGCMHIRPYIDLRHSEELKLLQQIMRDVSTLVLQYGGALSGEHGDGVLRTWLNKKMFGETLYRAFCEVKQVFDPKNLMNPGKVVQGDFPLEQLRLSPKTPISEVQTFLDFTPEGGFALAADLCNGNALCRKKEQLMCPSFQATQDETHTTRARAQTVRALIHCRLNEEVLTSPKLREVLELCLSCKGCKTECPSQVDMAKIKAEFLFHYQEKHGYALRDKLFAHMGSLYRAASFFPTLFNALSKSSMARSLLSTLQIASDRTLPPLASRRFSRCLRSYKQPSRSRQVVLFNDTFTEFIAPDIGLSAVKLLNALGYGVIVPPWNCCAHPMLSKGFLKEAKKHATTLLKTLLPYAHLPIIGLEPSCILTLKTDHPSLIGKHLIAPTCTTLDEFLQEHITRGELPLPWKPVTQNIKVHGHCHQKALVGMQPTLNVLRAIPGFSASELIAGCCGMAGAFGYEKEHASLSKEIGELHLLPQVRKAPPETLIIANGISCRSQISHQTSRQAYHLAQILSQHMI